MELKEELKRSRKEYIYDVYYRLFDNPKDYEKISRLKMIEEIIKLYSDYNNIISICTTRELKYLKQLLENKDVERLDDELNEKLKRKDIHYKSKYNWERETLRNKFLLILDYDTNKIIIPEEIKEYVKEAIKKVDWKQKKLNDRVDELLIGYCKTLGSSIMDVALSFVAQIYEVDKEKIKQYAYDSKLFNYYVLITTTYLESFNSEESYLICYDCLEYIDELENERKEQALPSSKQIILDDLVSIFYNDFNFNNNKIKKFIDELDKYDFYKDFIIEKVKYCSMLNIDRNELKDFIRNYNYRDEEETEKLINLLDEAMDEMTSGALNGLTPKEAKKTLKEMDDKREEKIKNYRRQRNAHISVSDKNLFYKIYFALLEFTNNKYKINPRIKIYKQININPHDIYDIVDKFWDNKELIITEFCLSNPYKFNMEEIKITSEFKKGIRGNFILYKYEEEYTVIMNDEKTFMIKGLTGNIDEIIINDNLPSPVLTSIIPFKNNIIYDGLIAPYPVIFDIETEKQIDKQYKNQIKYYHL